MRISRGMRLAYSAKAVSTQPGCRFDTHTITIDYDDAYEPRAYLAESWELADDMTSVTFHIRQDVYWHDGEQTDAHDVEES